MKLDHPEKNIVTIVAFDVVGSTSYVADLDPDDAEIFLDQIYEQCKRAIEREDGMLANFAGDGGIAVFGWPRPMEDHADRACHAAWSIHEMSLPVSLPSSPDGEAVQFRIGVHSGLVGLRRIKYEDGHRLDLVGGTIHLAATLEKKAPPTKVLVSSHTLKLCRSDISTQPYDTIPLLQRIGASAHLLLGRPQRQTAWDRISRYKLPMVGRRREKSALLKSLNLKSQSVSTVAIVGEPGIGKSRLAAAVIDDATRGLSQPTVISVAGDPRLASAAFSIPREILAHIVSNDPRQTDEIIDISVRKVKSEAAARVLFGPADEVDARELTPNEVGSTFAELIAELLRNQRTILLVEDLHFADPDSCVCLEFVKSINCDLKLIVTARTEAAGPAARIAVAPFQLGPMSRNDLLKIASNLLGDECREKMFDAVDRAEGIPLLMEQIAISIREGTSVESTPQGIQSLVHARLNSLPPTAKSHAQTLSVIGEHINTELASDLLGVEKGNLADELGALRTMSILDDISDSGVSFVHAVIAEACKSTVTTSRKQKIHLKAIESIKARAAGKPEELYQLAHHARGANDSALAIDYLWSAALQARKIGADRTLNEIFDKAIELTGSIGSTGDHRFVDFVLLAATALLQLGEFEKIRRHLPKAQEIATRLNQRDKVCAAKCHMGMVYWFDGSYAQGLAETEEAVAISEELASLPLEFAAQIMLAFNLHASGRIREAIALQKKVVAMMTGKLETARLGGPGIQGPIARAFLAWFLMDAGDHEESMAELKKAHSVARRAGDAYAQIICLNSLGRNYFFLGMNERAVSEMEANLKLISRSGYYAIQPHVTGFFAAALARTGKAERAIGEVKAVLTSDLERRTGKQELFQLYCGYGEALFACGKQGKAVDWVSKAVALADSVGHPCLQVHGLGVRARLLEQMDGSQVKAIDDRNRQSKICNAFGVKAWF